MLFQLSTLRIAIYSLLGVFALILLGLTGARLQYTEHLKPNDPLNGGRPFHDPIVAELLATAVLAIMWAVFVVRTIYGQLEFGIASTFIAEVVGLSLLFLLFLVGAAKSSAMWGDLSFCHQYHACRVLSAMVGFAWLTWVVVGVLGCMSVFFVLANEGAWRMPMHGRWDPRVSRYRESSVRPVSV